MANRDHLNVLANGVEFWNHGRKRTLIVPPDLTNANLNGAKLHGIDFHGADLAGVNFESADLSDVNFRSANLSHAKLCRATLVDADFTGATLTDADVTQAGLGGTTLADLDLSSVRGLTTVDHLGPSSIGVDTVYKSQARIPDVFLRGSGMPEDFILYLPSMVIRPIEFYSCFISYNHRDKAFARRLQLEDGDVLLTYGERNKPFGVQAILSHDDGKTWSASSKTVLADDAPSPDCGYPSSVQLPEGNIVTVYYHVDNPSDAPASTKATAVIWRAP